MPLQSLALGNNQLIERVYPQPPHNFRTEFMRDRDRIVHSQAFRRMEYKTQVIMNLVGDNFRTRLTHSLEVSQISRTLARVLDLNEDYAETIALGHDMGHTPFGHLGEKILKKLTKKHGGNGFEHNQQTLRIVEHLENRYPQHPGLNLTLATRIGLNKHSKIQGDYTQPLESSLVNTCDEMAYLNHDTDDGIETGLLDPEQLQELALWREFWLKAVKNHPKTSAAILARYTIRNIINYLAEDLIENSTNTIKESGISSFEDLMAYQKDLDHSALINYSQSIKAELASVKKFHFKNLYNHPQVLAQNKNSEEAMEKVFYWYYDDPGRLPSRYYESEANTPVLQAICDCIASQTDRKIYQLADSI